MKFLNFSILGANLRFLAQSFRKSPIGEKAKESLKDAPKEFPDVSTGISVPTQSMSNLVATSATSAKSPHLDFSVAFLEQSDLHAFPAPNKAKTTFSASAR